MKEQHHIKWVRRTRPWK